MKAAVYIDGFNLYHAIRDLEQPHLRWLNLWALSESLISSKTESLVRVVWCTAQYTKDVQKMLRHRAYKKALTAMGVDCVEGHFSGEERICDKCGFAHWKETEKEGDVNLAVHLISDAHLGVFDAAYIVSADSDQVATAKLMKARHPDKRIISVAPPQRPHSKHILELVHDHRVITRETIESCLFPKTVTVRGRFIVDRPDRYAPPPRWHAAKSR